MTGNVAMGNIPTGSYPLSLNYTADQQLYAALINSGTPLGTMAAPYQHFIQASQNTDIASLYALNQDFMNIYTSPSMQQVATAADTLYNYLWNYSTTSAQLDSLALAQAVAVIATLHAQAMDSDSTAAVIKSNQLNNIIGNVGNRKANGDIADHQYQLVPIVADLMAGNAIDSTDIAAVEIIANGCPLAYGKATYMARAILQYLEIPYNDEDEILCTAPLGRKAKQSNNSENTEVIVYPNPAKDQIYISNLNAPCDVYITNTSGIEVYHIHHEGDQDALKVNSAHWQAGIYYITIRTQDDKEDENIKVIIID
jgi:hypothetical protein